ncbi:FesM [Chloroflexi bacterium TSY]|nr:FesM [Chloroflexi bacterium TSY]
MIAQNTNRFQFDLLRIPLLGHFLKWKHSRTALQILLLIIAAAIIIDGFLGTQLAAKNVATVSAWVHYRGLVVLALLLVGNLFCAACPFILPRRLAKWLGRPTQRWPSFLRNKWFALVGLLGIFFAYELFNLWNSPWLTAWVAVAYFALAFVLEAFFTRSSFCKYVCPLGSFNFLYSTLSPTQIASRDLQTCHECVGKECVNGVTKAEIQLEEKPLKNTRDDSEQNQSRAGHNSKVIQDGCQLELFVPTIQSNMDCTFCLDCVKACPHDNVALIARLPGNELFRQTWRHRIDLAFLAILTAYIGLVNAFAMTPPVYEIELGLADLLNTQNEAIVLGIVFFEGAIMIPLLLVYGAAWLGRRLSGSRETLNRIIIRHAYSFVPMGFAIWFSHYMFHFLIGPMTIIPAVQTFFQRTLSWPLFGPANWRLASLFVLPINTLQLIQTVAVYGGLLAAIALTLQAARKTHKNRRNALLEALPWIVVLVLLAIAGGATFLLPMEMRGNVFG